MTTTARILVVDDDRSVRELVPVILRDECEVIGRADAASAFAALRAEGPFDLLLLDLKLPGMSGLEVLRKARPLAPETPVIMMTANTDASPAVQAMKLGARDYLIKPFDPAGLRFAVQRLLKERALEKEVTRLRAELQTAFGFDQFIGTSPAMQKMFAVVRRLLDTDLTALIQGETGTGKELVARALHYHGCRRDGPFIPVHCAAIPGDLLESELFGHEKGAFTGALQRRIGLFEAASGGTLFLDEIGEMPLATQTKLLRALQEHEIRRVGGQETIPINTRLVCATNRNLEQEMKTGGFRADLFYRINVVPIVIPPLRDRREDVPLLVLFFAERAARQFHRPEPQFTPAALEWLTRHPWPGNVRQLEHAIERLLVLAPAQRIDAADITALLDPLEPPAAAAAPAATTNLVTFTDGRLDLPHLIATVEHAAITEALRRSAGVYQDAAASLHITRRMLRYKMRLLNIPDPGKSLGGTASPRSDSRARRQ